MTNEFNSPAEHFDSLAKSEGIVPLNSLEDGAKNVKVVGVVLAISPPIRASNGGTCYRIAITDPSLLSDEHFEVLLFGSVLYPLDILIDEVVIIPLTSGVITSSTGFRSAGSKIHLVVNQEPPSDALNSLFLEWWPDVSLFIEPVSFHSRPLRQIKDLVVGEYCDIQAQVVDIYGYDSVDSDSEESDQPKRFSIGISDFTTNENLQKNSFDENYYVGCSKLSKSYTIVLTFYDEHIKELPANLISPKKRKRDDSNTQLENTKTHDSLRLHPAGLTINSWIYFRNLYVCEIDGRLALARYSDFKENGQPKQPAVLFNYIQKDDPVVNEMKKKKDVAMLVVDDNYL